MQNEVGLKSTLQVLAWAVCVRLQDLLAVRPFKGIDFYSYTRKFKKHIIVNRQSWSSTPGEHSSRSDSGPSSSSRSWCPSSSNSLASMRYESCLASLNACIRPYYPGLCPKMLCESPVNHQHLTLSSRIYCIQTRETHFESVHDSVQIIFYSPVLFSSLGSSQSEALLSTVIVGAVNVLSTLVAVFGVDYFGRRVLLLEAGVQVLLSFW